MPGFNRKGPDGQGPMTGRRMGRCTSFGTQSLKEDSGDQIPELPAGRFKNRGTGMGGGRQCRGRHYQN